MYSVTGTPNAQRTTFGTAPLDKSKCATGASDGRAGDPCQQHPAARLLVNTTVYDDQVDSQDLYILPDGTVLPMSSVDSGPNDARAPTVVNGCVTTLTPTRAERIICTGPAHEGAVTGPRRGNGWGGRRAEETRGPAPMIKVPFWKECARRFDAKPIFAPSSIVNKSGLLTVTCVSTTFAPILAPSITSIRFQIGVACIGP